MAEMYCFFKTPVPYNLVHQKENLKYMEIFRRPLYVSLAVYIFS